MLDNGDDLRDLISERAIDCWLKGDRAGLDKALALRPWEISPAIAWGTNPYPRDSAGGASWPRAVRLRAALEAASRRGFGEGARRARARGGRGA
jgi:hypothetical protein